MIVCGNFGRMDKTATSSKLTPQQLHVATALNAHVQKIDL
jgi:hypothetical protein